jgi:ABC-type bacteriocin/lantibiotic exporter with double-glycine peptidase domain
MELIYLLIEKFMKEEYVNTILLFVLCIIINIIQTNGISMVTANIITHMKGGSKTIVYNYIYWFIGLSFAFLLFYYLYKKVQVDLITKLRQWTRFELLKVVLLNNNENYSEKSFMELDSPIARMSTVSFMLFNDVITFLIPTLIFIFIIICYVFDLDIYLGIFFTICNIFILVYPYVYLEDIVKKNEDYEKAATYNEFYVLELLNNMDKIIFRGEAINEISIFRKLSDMVTKLAYDFYSTTIDHSTVITIFIYLTMFVCIYYSAYLRLNNQMSLTTFITLFSIIILYREKMSALIQNISDFVEFYGRINSVLNHFDNMDINLKFGELAECSDKDLTFDLIRFEDVSFKYKTADTLVFDKLNLNIKTEGKIIGICGFSGRGKSTFAKLLLKIYNKYEGNVFIDECNIKDIDVNYLRKNVTYINQNSKLFDRVPLENFLYGCTDESKCKENLDIILKKYPKIQNLYKNVDIYKKKAGSLGENLSGGQRQVTNLISGLINPSKILILDEPTNALDPSLKGEILQLIRDFKKQKKCIIIISHDRDVFNLFDERIDL